MFNLLPTNEKKRILQEYRLRLLTVILFFSFSIGLVATLFLLPSYLISNSKDKEVAERIESVRMSTIFSEADEINSRLVETNLKMQSLVVGQNFLQISDLFDKILQKKTSAIRINSIGFSVREEEKQIVLSGVSLNRDSLSDFVRSLEEDETFSEVSIPVSSFAKERNAVFSIQLSVAP